MCICTVSCEQPLNALAGMLANALPKMTNLKNVHCSMRWKDIYAFMRILESIHHRLLGLSLMYVLSCRATKYV